MRALARIALCLLLLNCGPTLTTYSRTSPRRVEISRHVSRPSLYALAVRAAPDRIDVRLKHVNRVALRHIMHYNSAAIIYDHSGSVINELYEMIVGFAVVAGFVMGISASQNTFDGAQLLTVGTQRAGFDGSDTRDERVVWHRRYLLALLDPTVSVSTNRVRIDPVVKQQIFSDTPIVREYAIRLPSSEVVVSFRVLDEAEHELVRGSATTNSYGELQIRGALEHAVAVELSADGSVIVIPIQPNSAPVATTPVVRAAMPRALAAVRRADDNRVKWNKDSHLPRLTLMLDTWRMFSSGFSIFGEVPLHRKLSVGGLVGLESVSPDPFVPELVAAVGGSWRFYVIGHVGEGLHLGLEGLRGFRGIVPGSDTVNIASFGLTIGYKRIVRCGRTFELAIGRRLQMIDDSMGPWEYSWQWRPQINVGWSF